MIFVTTNPLLPKLTLSSFADKTNQNSKPMESSTDMSARAEETKTPPTGAEEKPSNSTNNEYTQVPSTTLEILSKLFPEKKKSVLELVLRRCGDDLLKAIEQCNPLRDEFNYLGYECGKRHGRVEKMKNLSTGMIQCISKSILFREGRLF